MKTKTYFIKMLSVLICLALVAAIVPMNVFAADFNMISVVNLTGAQDVENLDVIKTYNSAVSISNGGDRRYYVKSVICYEAYDSTSLSNGDELQPGVEYYLNIDLRPNDGYSFPARVSTGEDPISVTVDGAEISYKDCRSIAINNSAARGLCVRIYFTTPGDAVEYLNNIDLTVLDKPIYGKTPLKNNEACKVPDDAPYEILDAYWRYKVSNGGCTLSQNFCESSAYQLWVQVKPKEGENVRFVSNTNVNLDGFNETTARLVSRSNDGICYLYLHYENEYPPTYSVTYDPCGGTFPDGKTEAFVGNIRADGTVSHLFTEMKKQGYNFDGWYTDSVGGTKVTAASKFTAPTIVYAHWIPCIDTVYINNVVLPSNGKEPVFTAKIPSDAKYSIAQQSWWTGDEENMMMVSTLSTEMTAAKMMEEELGKEIILHKFDSTKIYNYTIDLIAEDGYDFGKETTVYLNGKAITVKSAGNDLSVETTYDCAPANNFEIYEGATVKSGVCGTAIETLDLNNYLRSNNNCTFTAVSGKPSWLSLSSNGKLTGTRPSTAQAATEFTVNVSDGSTTKVMTVSVEEVTAQWIFIEQPKNIYADFCDSQFVFSVNTTAENPVYTWEMYEPTYKTWFPMSTLAPALALEYMEFENAMAFSVSEENPVDFTGCLFRCKVKANGVTKTSDSAKLTVEHRYADAVPTPAHEGESHTLTCKQCGATKIENHNFRYELEKAATEEHYGNYRKICIDCGKTILSRYDYNTTDKVLLTLDFNGGDVPADKRTVLVTQYSATCPLAYYPVRNGYVFEGWALSKDATEAVYEPDADVLMVEGSTLYAVWRPLTVIVNGVFVTADNMNDILGDGTVSLLLPNNTHKTILQLNGANLEAKFVKGINKSAAVYSENPIEIYAMGDKSTIALTGGDASGIYALKSVGLSGTELEIIGNTQYENGIKAKTVSVGVENLVIRDAKYAICGDTEFYGGNTYIASGKYTDAEFKAVNGSAELNEYYDADVSAADDENGEFTESALFRAIEKRNVKIESVASKKGKLIKITEIVVDVPVPEAGQIPGTEVSFAGEGYTAAVEGWYKKSTDGVSYLGEALGEAETIATTGNTVYIAKIKLTADAACEFAEIGELTATVNDQSTDKIDKNDNDLFVYAEFTFAFGMKVSGKVTSFGKSSEATIIQLFTPGSNEVAYETIVTGLTADYTISGVAAGTYTMTVSKTKHATREYTVTVSSDTTQNAEIRLCGDMNGNGEINEYDYQQAVNVALSGETKVAKDLSEDADYRVAVADFDGDGYVDVLDVVMIERKAKHITA